MEFSQIFRRLYFLVQSEENKNYTVQITGSFRGRPSYEGEGELPKFPMVHQQRVLQGNLALSTQLMM